MAASNLYTKDKTSKDKTNSVTFAIIKPKFNFKTEYVFLKYILIGILFLKSIVCRSIVLSLTSYENFHLFLSTIYVHSQMQTTFHFAGL